MKAHVSVYAMVLCVMTALPLAADWLYFNGTWTTNDPKKCFYAGLMNTNKMTMADFVNVYENYGCRDFSFEVLCRTPSYNYYHGYWTRLKYRKRKNLYLASGGSVQVTITPDGVGGATLAIMFKKKWLERRLKKEGFGVTSWQPAHDFHLLP